MGRIGEKIKQARLKENMQAKQLAKKCGVSESYILDVECGKKVINDMMIKKISTALKVNLDEPLYKEEEETVDEVQEDVKILENKNIAPEWKSAFSNIIRDIPIYSADMKTIVGYKHLPVIDKKVEGYNPEKLFYISVSDNTLSGFRIKKDDLVMLVSNPEPLNNGLCMVEYDGKKAIRLVKKIDSDKLLLLSNPDEIRAETKHLKEIKILGHCIKAEITFSRM